MLSSLRSHLPRLLQASARLSLPLTLLVGISAARAAGIDDIRGAWGLAGIPCEKIFVKKGNGVAFVSHFGEYIGGFVIEGKTIHGARETCRLLSSKQKPNAIVVVLGCREEIIFDKISVSLRIENENTLVRFDPEVPELETTYNRCFR